MIQNNIENNTEILPDTWKIIKLDNVANISSGGSAPQGDQYFDGRWPFIRVSHLDVDSLKIKVYDYVTDEAVEKYRLKKYPKGTIVFPKSGASIRLEKRAIIPEDSYIVNHLCTVLAKPKIADQHFLLYALKHHKFADNKASGYPTLSLTEIKNTRLPFPSLHEQRAIAQVLSSVRQAIEATEGVITAARELKRSMMKHLFTYGPIPVDQADQVPLKETEIGEIPQEWDVERLGNIAEIEYGIQAAVASNTDPKIGIPILTNKNINLDGTIDLSSLSYYNLTESEKHKLLNKGDVLFNWRSGSQHHVGKSVLFNKDGVFTCSSFILRFRVGDKVISEFLANELYKMWSNGYFVQKRSQSSVNSVYNKSASQKMPIVYPNIDKQRLINDYLSTVNQKINVETDKRKGLESLFNSLLHHLMTGKVRVQIN